MFTEDEKRILDNPLNNSNMKFEVVVGVIDRLAAAKSGGLSRENQARLVMVDILIGEVRDLGVIAKDTSDKLDALANALGELGSEEGDESGEGDAPPSGEP